MSDDFFIPLDKAKDPGDKGSGLRLLCSLGLLVPPTWVHASRHEPCGLTYDEVSEFLSSGCILRSSLIGGDPEESSGILPTVPSLPTESFDRTLKRFNQLCDRYRNTGYNIKCLVQPNINSQYGGHIHVLPGMRALRVALANHSSEIAQGKEVGTEFWLIYDDPIYSGYWHCVHAESDRIPIEILEAIRLDAMTLLATKVQAEIEWLYDDCLIYVQYQPLGED